MNDIIINWIFPMVTFSVGYLWGAGVIFKQKEAKE